jgi:hypothetical protein
LDYNFTFIHRPGLLNVLPDHLSRLFPPHLFKSREEVSNSISLVAFINTSETPTEVSTALPSPDPNVDTQSAASIPSHVASDAASSAREGLLQSAHEFGHFGSEAMFNRLLHEGHNWSSMRADCVKVAKQCVQCQRYNVERQGFHPPQSLHAELPFDHICIDLAGPYPTTRRGNNFIFIVVDVCTRFLLLRPLQSKSAQAVATCLFHIFCDFGFPKILQSDNGGEFSNQVIKEICKYSGISQRLISPYNPRANGLAERFVQTATRSIKKSISGDTTSWDLWLPSVQLAVNSKVAAVHGSTPFSVMFARKLNPFADFSSTELSLAPSDEDLQKRLEYITNVVYPSVAKRSKSSSSKLRETFLKNHKILKEDFPSGSFVMMIDSERKNKLEPVYLGPFKVLRRNRGGAYVLQDMQGSLLPRNVPASHLKLVSKDSMYDEASFDVEAIIDHRGAENQREYLVKWKHYGPEYNDWIPTENFDDIALVTQYWERRRSN